jgi:hypothetical protein
MKMLFHVKFYELESIAKKNFHSLFKFVGDARLMTRCNVMSRIAVSTVAFFSGPTEKIEPKEKRKKVNSF